MSETRVKWNWWRIQRLIRRIEFAHEYVATWEQEDKRFNWRRKYAALSKSSFRDLLNLEIC